MARPLRIQYEGAIYHLMNRGDRRQAIFRADTDRHLFIETLAATCERTGWQVHAYCLMSNHFHLVVETPRANLVAGMKWLLGTYTIRFNRRHDFCGHLFGGRYKAQAIDETTPNYLRVAADYVHLNPARAGLVEAGDRSRATLEQLSVLSGGGKASACLAAGGSGHGRTWNRGRRARDRGGSADGWRLCARRIRRRAEPICAAAGEWEGMSSSGGWWRSSAETT